MSAIPQVCHIADLVTHLGVSRRTIERARRARLFPIPELERIGSRPRWAGADVQRYLDRHPAVRLRRAS